MVLLAGGPARGQARDINKYLHPKARLGIGLPGDRVIGSKTFLAISPKQAAAYAVMLLKKRGISEIVICESHWIAGAVSGYLIDCRGKWIYNHQTYSQFRIGVCDGLEAKYGARHRAGTEFVFIGLGRDKDGKSIWHPPPGPDYRPRPDETVTNGMLAYKFLLWRDKFLSLSHRYPKR